MLLSLVDPPSRGEHTRIPTKGGLWPRTELHGIAVPWIFVVSASIFTKERKGAFPPILDNSIN